VETAEAVPGSYSLRLLDATGKLIWRQDGQGQTGTNKFSVDLQSFAGGQYFLLFTMPSISGESKTLTYTIQKLN